MEQKTSTTRKRLANIELLRIISMLMVITLHFLGRGGVNQAASPLTTGWFLSVVWDGLAIISVNLYVLISGYFLVNSKFKFQKLVDIIIQVFSYSFIIYVVMILVGKNSFSIVGFAKAFLPLLTNQYWFASAYVGLYILFPFLNAGLHSLTQKQHKVLCIVMALLFTLYLPSTALGQSGTSIVWVICLYIFGAYIRLYYNAKMKISGKMVLCYIVPALLLPLSKVCITLVAKYINNDLIKYNGWFYKYNSIFVLWAAIALFVIFLNLDIKSEALSKAICTVGGLTFGVYLFHNNPSLRDHLWNWLDLTRIMNKWWFFFAGVGIILVIFIISALFEFVRKKLYSMFTASRFYKWLSAKLSLKIDCFLKKHNIKDSENE